MFVYLFLLFVLFALSFRGVGKKLFLLLIVFLSIILGFRGERVGTDTFGYIDYYNSLSFDIFSGYMEIGWNFISIICKLLNLSAYSFHFIVALLTLLSYYVVAVKFEDRKINCYVVFLLFSLGFYFHMFNIMRQLLAMSIVLLGYDKLASGKTVSFVVYVIIASFIHYVSLFSLLMILALKIEFSVKFVVLILSISFVAGFYLGENLFSMIAGRYAHDIDTYGFRVGYSFFLTVGLLTNLLTLWLFISNNELRTNMWIRFNVLSVVVLNLSSGLVLGSRIVYFFSICSVMAYAFYMRYSKNILSLPILYMYAIITFGRYLIPEWINSDIDGSMVPYSMNLIFFM